MAAATTGCLCKIGVMDVALLRPAVVYDLLLEVWHVLAAEILSYAKSSRSSGSDDHPCMSSKAEKLCSSEKCGESFFCSSVRYVIGCMWACIYYALKRSGVAPPC